METKVTTKDLIGDLKDFPIEVVEKMMEYQYEQLGKTDIAVFQYNAKSGNEGFYWSDTIEGCLFWNAVINRKEFDIFFERYPKLSKNVYIRGDRNNREKVIEELKKKRWHQ